VSNPPLPPPSDDPPLATTPPMTVLDVVDVQDGIYVVFKNKDSVFLWVSQNFCDLVGMTKEQLIGHKDTRAAHVRDDKKVMASGKPLLNYHEVIAVPTKDGGWVNVDIVTQKGLLRAKGGTEIIGVTVCFSLADPVQ
jgi:PAS domain-containing protein